MVACGFEVGLLFRERSAVVSCHCPYQTAARGDATVGSVDEAKCDSNGENSGGCFVARCLQYHFSERALCGRCEKHIDVDCAEEQDQDESNAAT